MNKPSDTTTKPQPASKPRDHLSLVSLMAVLVLTYVWFFSQALTYTT